MPGTTEPEMADATGREPPGKAGGGAWRRLGWFVLLWAGGVAAVSVVGLLIRAVLMP